MGTALFFSALFCLLIASRAQEDACKKDVGAAVGDEGFPLYYFDTGFSYEVEYASTNSPKSEVVYFEQIYSAFQKSGKLTYHKQGDTGTYTYFEETNELFLQQGDKCSSQELDRSKPFENIPNKPDWIFSDDKTFILGPLSIYYQQDKWSKTKPIINKGLGPLVRGKPSKIWQQCVDNKLYTFYFDAKDLEPLLIEIKETKGPTQTLNFYAFDKGYDESITIPFESNCKKNLPTTDKMPLLFDKDLVWEGEIIYMNPKLKHKAKEPKQFIVDFQVFFDQRSNSYALSHETWRSQTTEDGELVENANPYKRVHAIDAGVFYEINLNTKQCTVETTDDSLIYVELPDSSYLYLNDPEIVGNDDYDYLGFDVVDDVVVDVFEKTLAPYKMGGPGTWAKAVVTRMQYADQVNSGLEHKSFTPYKLVLKLYDADDKLARMITINVFNFFQNALPNHVEHFGIEPCEKLLSPSTWFKMVFTPAETYALRGHDLMEEIMTRDRDVELQFRTDLTHQSELRPSRLPEVLVDYTCDNMNIYAKVLGIPPATLSFGDLDEKQRIISTGDPVDTEDVNQCATLCLEDDCKAFAFCGDSHCIMTQATGEDIKVKDDKDCKLYRFRENLDADEPSDKLIKSFSNILNIGIEFMKKNASGIVVDVISFKHNKDMSRDDNDVEEFPDLVMLARKDSFQMTSEINNRTNKNNGDTIQVTEYYSFGEGFGKTIFTEQGRPKQLYFTLETNELFTVHPDRCFVQALNESMPFGEYERDLFKQDMIYHKDYISLIGPSALLLRTYERSIRESSSVHYEGPADDIRGQSTQVWVDCSDPYIDYKYYFTRPVDESELPVPLRITVESMGKSDYTVNQTYEIFNFHWQVDEKHFKLPHGKGCERLDIDSEAFPPLPSLPLDLDLFIRGEVVFDDRATDTPKKVMSNFMIAKDSGSFLTAYTTTNWTLNKKDELKSTDTFRHVYGINVETVVDDTTGQCYTEKTDDLTALIKFPGGFSLNIDENIIFGGAGYSYIDEYIERDLQTIVFERVLTDYKVSSEVQFPKAIITRFFLSNENKFTDEKRLANAPLRTRLKLYRAQNNSFVLDKVISFNFYEYKTRIINKPKIFNLEDCRLDQDSFMYFQVMYPFIDTKEFRLILEEEGSIIDTFIVDLLNSQIISPDRLSPNVGVATTMEHLVVTAKLLERTSPVYDYKEYKNGRVASIDETHIAMTKDECAQKCLDSGNCRGWSYCSMACYLSQKSGIETNKDTTCSTYTLDEDTFPLEAQELSLAKALEKIKERAEEGHFTIVLPPLDDGTKVRTLKSTSFSTDIPVNKNDFDDDTYYLAIAGKKFNEKLEGVTFFGDIFHQQCLEYCEAMDECVSLSMCALDTSCALYNKHHNDAGSNLVQSSECFIIEKKYSSGYNLFPGYSNEGNVKDSSEQPTLEKCAASCTKQSSFDCLSFDYCEASKECRQYQERVVKGNAGDKLKKSTCNHFSSKFLSDFGSNRNKQIKDVKDHQIILEDLDLEACAQNCVENSGIACTSFDYCGFNINGKGKCILTSQMESDLTTVSSTMCDHHFRKSALNAKHNYSRGLQGGMAVLFIVFGILLGIAGGFTYKNYIRKRS